MRSKIFQNNFGVYTLCEILPLFMVYCSFFYSQWHCYLAFDNVEVTDAYSFFIYDNNNYLNYMCYIK